jgi:hypothetical protein
LFCQSRIYIGCLKEEEEEEEEKKMRTDLTLPISKTRVREKKEKS